MTCRLCQVPVGFHCHVLNKEEPKKKRNPYDAISSRYDEQADQPAKCFCHAARKLACDSVTAPAEQSPVRCQLVATPAAPDTACLPLWPNLAQEPQRWQEAVTDATSMLSFLWPEAAVQNRSFYFARHDKAVQSITQIDCFLMSQKGIACWNCT